MSGIHVLIVTDLEGVAGVLDFDGHCVPEGLRNEAACRFLTEETNAAIRGFFDGGAESVTALDGHGSGGSLRIELLDPRARLQRGVGPGWPGVDGNFQVLAFVGQHAKSGTPEAHLSHTQMFDAIDFRLNGVSLGEYGQLAWSAAEESIATIFASGDAALGREVHELTPQAVFVPVKWGLNPPAPATASSVQCKHSQQSAIHLTPTAAQEAIYSGALHAMQQYRKEPERFRTRPPAGPYRAQAEYRPTGPQMTKLVGALPARRITTREQVSIAAALREFYREIEWIAPDGDRVVEYQPRSRETITQDI